MTCLPTVPLPNAGFDCPNEEIFMFLDKISHGHPVPLNVIAGVNPFHYAPSNLPDGIWFLVSSKEKEPAEHGLWKVKREACQLFSNSMIIGWGKSFENFRGQVPYEHWVMQKYWITHKGLTENDKVKETDSLCRVFLGGQQGMDQQKDQNTIETLVHSSESSVLKDQHASSSGSTNKSRVEKYATMQNLAAVGETANHLPDLPPDNDYLSMGDFLELHDLDDPASPSSSSDNSSCVTMTSDECFDSLALLKELDSEINNDTMQKDANYKFNITSSFRPNEVVMAPASPESYIGIKAPSEENVGTRSSSPALTEDNKEAIGTSQNGGRKGEKGRKKKHKNKYMCFMPFYIFF